MPVKTLTLLVPDAGSTKNQIQEYWKEWQICKSYYKHGFKIGAFDVFTIQEQSDRLIIYASLKHLLHRSFTIASDEDGEFTFVQGSRIRYHLEKGHPEASFHFYPDRTNLDDFFRRIDYFIETIYKKLLKIHKN